MFVTHGHCNPPCIMAIVQKFEYNISLDYESISRKRKLDKIIFDCCGRIDEKY
jgi:hypothetical protein